MYLEKTITTYFATVLAQEIEASELADAYLQPCGQHADPDQILPNEEPEQQDIEELLAELGMLECIDAEGNPYFYCV